MPRKVAQLYHTVVAKAIAQLRPPIQWRGGMLSEIFKGKGSSSTCSSYRDINLADHTATIFGKTIRTSLMPALSDVTCATQFGSGLHGGETAIAHLCLRSFFEIGRLMKKTVATLFLDIVTAFASMVRRIVFDVDEGDEVWLNKLSAAGYNDEDIATIYKDICTNV